MDPASNGNTIYVFILFCRVVKGSNASTQQRGLQAALSVSLELEDDQLFAMTQAQASKAKGPNP